MQSASDHGRETEPAKGDGRGSERSSSGAKSLLGTLAAAGVEVCFTNPGTSEMHIVAAFDQVAGVRPVLTLFEGVATGAADGYGRMAGKPAATLLHLGPGLANGLANLHNARRAATPLLNIVGDHATSHARHDAPLASDIAQAAGTVSGWVRSSTTAQALATDAALALRAACGPPGQIATLIVPADAAWGHASGPAPAQPLPKALEVPEERIAETARRLADGGRAALLLRGACLQPDGLEAAGRIRALTGVRILCDTFPPRIARGAGHVPVERIPYFAEDMARFLADLDLLVLVGSRPPAPFFAYPGRPDWLLPVGCNLHHLVQPGENGTTALTALADRMGASRRPNRALFDPPEAPRGALTGLAVGRAVAALLPEGAVVSDEAATNAMAFWAFAGAARAHDHLTLTGGSIGQGLPLAAGAAVACPHRKIVCLQGDGGGMYTLQALWTMARERLDVTTVILANRAYAILDVELQRVGAQGSGPAARSQVELRSPDLDWVKLAEGMGVEASRAESAEAFCAQFEDAMRRSGPRLIEAILDPG